MPYNVSHWKTKVLDGLQFSTDVVPEDCNIGLTPTINMGGDLCVYVPIGENNGIVGKLRGNLVDVGLIDCFGEHSGTDYADVLLPILRQSTGKLEAVLIWEEGDWITRLKVNDGQVTEEEIDL